MHQMTTSIVGDSARVEKNMSHEKPPEKLTITNTSFQRIQAGGEHFTFGVKRVWVFSAAQCAAENAQNPSPISNTPVRRKVLDRR